jgi:hypothetical protein
MHPDFNIRAYDRLAQARIRTTDAWTTVRQLDIPQAEKDKLAQACKLINEVWDVVETKLKAERKKIT